MVHSYRVSDASVVFGDVSGDAGALVPAEGVLADLVAEAPFLAFVLVWKKKVMKVIEKAYYTRWKLHSRPKSPWYQVNYFLCHRRKINPRLFGHYIKTITHTKAILGSFRL